MFDASEILFLDRAVDLHLLTPSQRGRLLSFQSDMSPGMRATTLVVDAGLMSEEEVRQVLDAIEEPRKVHAGGSMVRTAASINRKAEASAKRSSKAGPVVNKLGVAVTPDDLDALLGGDDDVNGGSDHKQAEDLARLAAVTTVVKDTMAGATQSAALDHPGNSEQAIASKSASGIPDGWEVSTDPYAGWVVGETGEWVQDPHANWQQDASGNWVVLVPSAPKQAFPMPGGGAASQAFPLPAGAEPSSSRQPLWPDERGSGQPAPRDQAAVAHAAPARQETYATKLAASPNEIEALLVE